MIDYVLLIRAFIQKMTHQFESDYRNKYATVTSSVFETVICKEVENVGLNPTSGSMCIPLYPMLFPKQLTVNGDENVGSIPIRGT